MSSSTNYTITTSFAGATGVGPYLLPPNFQSNPQALPIWIGQVAAPSTTPSTPGIGTSKPQPDFSLTFQKNQYNSSDPTVYAAVTVQPTNVFTDSRAALRASFTLFQQQVEALELQATPALIPGGARLLLNRVAASLPLRFDEILFYFYGLDPARQCIDLHPGMTLRIEAGGYQYCDGPSGPGWGLNSFVAYGASRLPIMHQPDGTLAFDPFVARFVPGYSLNPPAACPLSAAGLLDLQVAGNARRHIRLIYPTTFLGSGNVDNAATLSQTSCILLGADTYADLEAATADVLNLGTGCGKNNPNDQAIVSIAFTGRTIAVPEITVMLRNNVVSVPVGTTMRSVVQQIADPAPGQFLNTNLNGIVVTQFSPAAWRWAQATGQPIVGGTTGYQQMGITFAAAPPVPPPGKYGDQWDLPLLKGDFVWWHEMQPPST